MNGDTGGMAITTSCNQVLKGHLMQGSGVPEEYWELASQYRDELIHQAFSILGSMEDAEDVVQETFCEAFKDTSKISSESILASLRLINKTNALDRLRMRGRARQRDHAGRETRAFTTGGFSGIELRDSIEKALQTLPENLRAVVRLRYFEHLSYKQIADRLNSSVGAVGPLLSEAGIRLYSVLVPPESTPANDTSDPEKSPAEEPPQKNDASRKSSRRFPKNQ